MKKRHLAISTVAVIGAVVLFSHPAAHGALPDALYWTFNSPNGLQPVMMRSNLDGSGAQSLLQNQNGGDRPLALNTRDGYLYGGISGTITRYNLDGSNPTVIFNTTTSPGGISGIAVDTVHDKLYWTFNSPNGLQPVMVRSNLDGTGIQTLLQNQNGGDRPIALDLRDGHLYGGISGTITRYNLDGGDPTVIFNTTTSPGGISGIAVDTVHDKLYWTFNSPNGLQPVLMRSNLDGSGIQTLLQSQNGGDRPIALDTRDNAIYMGYSGTITRFNLDGTNPTVVFNTTTSPSGISGIAILAVPEPASIVLMAVGAAGVFAASRTRRRHIARSGR